MSDMVPTGSKYTDEDRMQAAVVYGAKGTFMAVERELGIPNNTVCNWSKSDWWDDAVARVRDEKANEHVAMYTALVTDAITYAHANLDKASPKDALIMAATATDKARLLMNQPTSISGKTQGMTELAEQFRKLSSQWKEKQVRVVSTQDKDEAP